MDFCDILKQGRKRFVTKGNKRGEYDNCDYCDKRKLVFEYLDSEKEFWYLCEGCADLFIKEGE